MSKITNCLFSLNNSKIKLFLKLLNDRKYRTTEAKFVVESDKCITEALKAGYDLDSIFACDYLADNTIIKKYQSKAYIISNEIAKKLSIFPTNQGMFAIFKYKEKTQIKNYDKPYLILTEIQDPINFGNILRLAKCFKIENVIIDEKTVDPFNPKVIRGSMGACFHLNIYCSNIITTIKTLQDKRYSIIATTLDNGSLKLNDVQWSHRFGLIFGNEGHGISDEIIKICNQKVFIPIAADFDSLNVNNAVAICLWEYYKWWKK